MNKARKISVVIPVYNVQEYLPRCLDSLAAQTFTEFEVICVDDGSTDASGRICDEYSKKDERFRVYHIENGGVSNARNYALALVESEWFAYLDSDDWVEPNYLELLYKHATTDGCEVVACLFERNTEYRVSNAVNVERKVLFETPKDCVHNFICGKESMQGMIWNKLYRTELFGDLRFETSICVNEDCLYTMEVMKRCKRAELIIAPLHHWFYRNNSLCHGRGGTADFRGADAFLTLLERTAEYGDMEIETRLQVNYVNKVLDTLTYFEYDKKAPDVVEAKKRCKVFGKKNWKTLGRKTKVKYLVAMYVPFLLKIVRRG